MKRFLLALFITTMLPVETNGADQFIPGEWGTSVTTAAAEARAKAAHDSSTGICRMMGACFAGPNPDGSCTQLFADSDPRCAPTLRAIEAGNAARARDAEQRVLDEKNAAQQLQQQQMLLLQQQLKIQQQQLDLARQTYQQNENRVRQLESDEMRRRMMVQPPPTVSCFTSGGWTTCQ